MIGETPWDAFNVALGLSSLASNVAAGNVPGAVLDAGGVILDVAATVIPGVPGGAATLIKSSRTCEAVIQKEITLSRRIHGEAAQHAAEAISQGKPSILTINREGAAANRAQSIGNLEKVPGKHLDEYPHSIIH